MKTLLLIDAYAMIYRAYYAFIRVPRINSKGENTSAIFGFLITLDDLIKRVQPTHLAVVFDPPGPTFRHEAYEQYKAQREETPEDIQRAVPIIKQILRAKNIPAIEVARFEADDVIGTLAQQGQANGFEVSRRLRGLYGNARQRLRAVGRRTYLHLSSASYGRI